MSICPNCRGYGEIVQEYKEKIYDIEGNILREDIHIKWITCPVCLGKKEV